MIKLFVMLILSSGIARAHEVQPTIADISVENGKLTLLMKVNLETFLAGVNLDQTEDTDQSDKAEDYDALRALPANEIETQSLALLDRWNMAPMIKADGAEVALTSVNLTVPEGIAEDLPRISEWALTGDLPAQANSINVMWPAGSGQLVLRQQGVDDPFTGLINGGDESGPISLAGGNAQSGWEAFGAYIPVGFDHILPKGLDHILFVLGLFLLSTQLRPLILQVTMFTLAHTVTLALGALGLVSVPGSIVEPLIAASIVFVAIENIFFSGLSRWRPLIVFGFGLLHGLGFASVLGDFGLPEDQFIPALIGFNVGVEIGQLTVIAVAAALIYGAARAAHYADLDNEQAMVREYPVMFRAVSVTGSLVIAIIGVWWVFERVFL